MTSAPDRTGSSPSGRVVGGRTRAEKARLIIAGTLGGLTVAFALLNLNRVEVNWILGTWETPLIVVIGISLLVGALFGYAIARRRYARAGAQRSPDQRG
jgi:uncharacterized integral membrane protein